jgi:hypothetical protein
MNTVKLSKNTLKSAPVVPYTPREDFELSLTGRKGGKVKKERQISHQIDRELRDYLTY